VHVVQAFKYLRIGRITCFCLFCRRQAKLLEQYCAKLLCGKDIELFPCAFVYVRLERCYARIKLFTHGAERIAIHREAYALHIVKHIYKRQLNFIIEFLKALRFKFTHKLAFKLNERRRTGF